MRRLSVVLAVMLLVCVPATALPQTPQTYSLTVTMPMGAGMTVKVARDGAKESVEQIVPKSANGPGMHIRQIYDFATHKYWTMDLDGGPCTLGTYTDSYIPSMFDPMSGIAEMTAELAKSKPAVLRTETVNGIATRVYEMPVPEIKGKMRIFLDEKRNFMVKAIMVPAGGKEQTQMEVTSVSFAKPAADLFVTPEGCQVQGGASGATGGHAEVNIDASAQGEQKLGAAKPAQEPAAAPASRARAAGRQPAPPAEVRVTEVRATGVQPAHYRGPSPAAFEFAFSVTASGPTEIKYLLLNHGDTFWESGTLTFDAAGTKTLKIPVKVGVPNGTPWQGWAKLQVYEPNKIESEPLKVSADCQAK